MKFVEQKVERQRVGVILDFHVHVDQLEDDINVNA